MSEKEKTYTLKKVTAELKKLNEAKEKKKAKIKELSDEIKATNSRIKELEVLHDQLYHEDLQRQIAEVWFKEQKMTGQQIQKFLELSRHLHDKIDILDVNMIVQAVTNIYSAQQMQPDIEPAQETNSDPAYIGPVTRSVDEVE